MHIILHTWDWDSPRPWEGPAASPSPCTVEYRLLFLRPGSGSRMLSGSELRSSSFWIQPFINVRFDCWVHTAYSKSTCLCLGDLEWDTKIDPFLTLFLLLVSGLERNSLFSSLSRLRSILLSAYCLSIFAFLASVGVATNIVSLKIICF